MSKLKPSGTYPKALSRLVLLAEDHPFNQKIATILLERMGFEAHIVADGFQAVTAAKKYAYDAILMDCYMPRMNGFEAAQAIRKSERESDRHVPIIAVTALAMAGDRERCLSSGMDDYITKPIDGRLLRDKLVFWMATGAICAKSNSDKVISIHDKAFATEISSADEPLKLTHLMDIYGDETCDLVSLFITSSDKTIHRLQIAVQQQDFAVISGLAHELKGASWAVGAEEIARLSVFIEQAAVQENEQLVNRTFARLTHQFGGVKQFVEAHLGSYSSELP